MVPLAWLVQSRSPPIRTLGHFPAGADGVPPPGLTMDFDQAVAAHTAWKRTLARHLDKRDGSLRPNEIALDDRCALGQWIHGRGEAEYHNLPEYSVLLREHARFHRCAAEVVRRANSGEAVDKQITVGARSEFTMASSAVVLAIMAIKKRAGG